MTQLRLLIFATRYDDVTGRTYRVARRLLSIAERAGVTTLALFEAEALGSRLIGAAADRPAVLAFYSHGNEEGAILAQDRQPCWTEPVVPDLSCTAVFAHACRGICWLKDQACCRKANLLVGYECDLVSPVNGSDQFWESYEEVNSFVPHRLAMDATDAGIRAEFYALCTMRFHELKRNGASTMELIAILQSRDYIVFVRVAARDERPGDA